MNIVSKLGKGLEWLVYPVLLVLLFWPTVFFQVTTNETFKVSSEFAIVVVAWIAVVAVGTARAAAGRPLLGGGKGSIARRFGIALLGWMIIATVAGYNPESSWAYTLTALAYMLLGQSLLGWVEMRMARRRFVLGAVLAMGLWQVFWGYLQWFKLPLIAWGTAAPVFTNGPHLLPGGFWLHDYLLAMGAAVRQSTVMGSLGNVNYYAEFLGLVLPLAVGVAVLAKPLWLRVLGGVGVAAMFFLLITAGSRGVLLGVVVGVIIAAAAVFGGKAFDLRRWWGTKQGKVTMVCAALLVFGAVAVAGGRLSDKVEVLAEGSDNSTASRLINWGSTLNLAAANPVVGVGPGAYKLTNVSQLRKDYPQGLPEAGSTTRFMQTHSEPLQALTELGIVGLALALLGLFFWAREVLTNPTLAPPLRFGLLWAVVSLVLASFFAFPLHLPLTALVFVILLAMGLARGEEEEPEAIPTALRPAYAAGTLLVTALTGMLAISHGVGPLFQGHRYEYAANQLIAKKDYAQAEVVLALADRHARFKSSIRWNWLKVLVLQKKHEEAIALYRASERWGLGMDSHYWYARSLHLTGRTGEAQEAYEALMNYYPPSHSLHKRSVTLSQQL